METFSLKKKKKSKLFCVKKTESIEKPHDLHDKISFIRVYLVA